MFQYRVTKYDPANRDARGAYVPDEWTSIRDIGRVFSGEVLTQLDYRQIEDAYAGSAVAFLREAEIQSLAVRGLENHLGTPLQFAEGAALSVSEIGAVIRRLLREEFRCRLEGTEAFIHIGWDYYMYFGVPSSCAGAQALAEKLGLFVEPFVSPYLDQMHAS